jgi:hypothetical protein
MKHGNAEKINLHLERGRKRNSSSQDLSQSAV